MIFSNKLKSVSYIAKGLYWFSFYVMKPQTKYNHIIWGIFLSSFSILAAQSPNKPTNSQIEQFSELDQSIEFWVAIALVVIFNIAVGIYTAKRNKKDRI